MRFFFWNKIQHYIQRYKIFLLEYVCTNEGEIKSIRMNEVIISSRYPYLRINFVRSFARTKIPSKILNT